MKASVVHERTTDNGARCGAEPMWFVGDTRPVDCRKCLLIARRAANPKAPLRVHAKGDGPLALCGTSKRIGEPVTCGVCLRAQKARSKPEAQPKGHEMRDSGQAFCGAWPDSFDDPVTCKTCLRAIEARR